MDNENYRFRNIDEIDYEFIYQLKKDAYKKYVEANWGTWNEHDQREYFENFINRIKNDVYIIQFEDKDIGFYNGEMLENGDYEIGNICIIPQYQRKGIGTSILKRILAQNEDRDIIIQYFKQNPVGKLYERLGFISNGETQYHYRMIKLALGSLKR